jgi:hypothetical protein
MYLHIVSRHLIQVPFHHMLCKHQNPMELDNRKASGSTEYQLKKYRLLLATEVEAVAYAWAQPSRGESGRTHMMDTSCKHVTLNSQVVRHCNRATQSMYDPAMLDTKIQSPEF